jgi:3-dehydroquinate synthase
LRVVEEEICCSKTKVFIGRGVLKEAVREIPKGCKIALIRQDSVDPSYLLQKVGRIEIEIVLRGGEESKSIESVLRIVGELYSKGFDRSDYLVALGGGALSDTAGLAAALYLRGLNLVNVPTTLLAMVDAAVGGKVAVNMGNMKNVLGVFYQPSLVIIDLEFLSTLPKEELVNGLAEVVKYAFTLDSELYSYLKSNNTSILSMSGRALEEVIAMSVKNKLTVVREDPYDTKGVRVVLNYGHTVGHAIEALSHLRVGHGRAVAVGMVYEAIAGAELGYTKPHVVDKLVELLKAFGLPTSLEEVGLGSGISTELFKAIVSRDKKVRRGKLLLPVVIDVGSWRAVEVPVEELVEVLVKCVK